MTRLLALIALLVTPIAALAQSPQGPNWPGVTLPSFVIPASAVNGSGVVTSAQLLAPDGSASAPSYSFASDPDTGIASAGPGTIGFYTDGVRRGFFAAATLTLTDTVGIAWSDVSLSRGAANRLDLATADSFNLVGGGASYMIAAVPVISSTAPTVTSAGTSPSVAGASTLAFRVNVGTGGTASAIVLAMPAATTGWNCHAENLTAAAANRANQTVKQQSSTTTAVTVQNQTISTGAALAFTASDIVSFLCAAY